MVASPNVPVRPCHQCLQSHSIPLTMSVRGCTIWKLCAASVTYINR